MSPALDAQLATTLTAKHLREVAVSQPVRALSHLTLPEIEAVIEVIAQIIPAGNVPGMILSGLARLPAQRLPRQMVQQHLAALFSGVEQVFDQVTFGTVFAGPAAVIWGYQNLLKLAGKDPAASFPEGLWQFYVDYALREDTARHVNETHGFDTLLREHGLRLSETDRLTAWVMAAISCLHQYDALLEIEWRERVATSLLRQLTQALPEAGRYANLYRDWELQRPYRRGAEAASYDYPAYRRIKFEHFLEEALRDLPAALRTRWAAQMKTAEADLPAYQKQMSILAYLQPGQYGETRIPYAYDQVQVGLVLRGNYYLFPVYLPGTDQLLEAETVRAQIAALLAAPGLAPAHLIPLAQVKRAALAELRPQFSPDLQENLNRLRFAPILFNADLRHSSLPLTELRQAERGIGDHALTIFQTEKTFVFDQSHIFFDGILGAALAEILTNEALSWAVYLQTLPPARSARQWLVSPLHFSFTPAEVGLIQQAPRVTPETSAETEKIDLKACLGVRKLFKQRSQTLQLSVNDLLLLYRAIHALEYQPSPALSTILKEMANQPTTRPLATAIQQMLAESRRQNPALLIPIDASRGSPRDRLYPLAMQVPLAELDLLNLHRRTLQALDAYERASGDRSAYFAEFDQAQRLYLATLAGLGVILTRLKEIAIRGESASVGAIKLLAHLPQPLQRLLDKIPERFEILNNLLKGNEVFSNVGAVVPSSTLTRFVTAKDDNEQKQLAWGILTDAGGVVHLSLRDFRPHVAALKTIHQPELAHLIAQDYLEAFAAGFNQYLRELHRITVASRDSHFVKALS